MRYRKILPIFVLLMAITLTGCSKKDPNMQNNIPTTLPTNPPEVVGGDKDEHGCIPSAGYQWNEEKQMCVRPWEEEKKSIEEKYAKTSPILLKDVNNGEASGEAWIILKDNVTYHRIFARNMVELQNDDFYEGWLVQKSTGEFFSTGKMTFNEKYQNWLLEYQAEGDKTNYTKVVITLEPNDGDSAPAKHILEN